jgi:hypothetical protein
LLTGESLRLIADRCWLRLSVVTAFAKVFFDVRDRLGAGDWIALRAIGPGLWTGFRKEEIGSLWKAFAFSGGVQALDAVVAISIEEGLFEGEDLAALVPRPDLDDDRRQKVRLAILARMLPANAPPRQFLQLHLRLLEMEGQAAAPPTSAVTAAVHEGFFRPVDSGDTQDSFRNAAVA